jgi:hypothetical protein
MKMEKREGERENLEDGWRGGVTEETRQRRDLWQKRRG